ncbi:hypothetical protein BJF79_07375 [Actinomadura sp. CNU-125]|nr:hypothetical protein BJF79_07375 [Actinomadura sp. CNU-125]
MEEAADLGPAHAVVVYHPYYENFAAWARQTLTADGHARYMNAAHRPPMGARHQPGADRLRVDLVPQRGPYGDLTSVFNAADHLGDPDELYVAFSDNLYPGAHALRQLRDRRPAPCVLVRPYRPDLAKSRGVIITDGHRMIGLEEKPDAKTASRLEQQYGARNLLLLEGRIRITRDFVHYARHHHATANSEPKLALTLADYAKSHSVGVVVTNHPVIDLGAPTAPSLLTTQ